MPQSIQQSGTCSIRNAEITTAGRKINRLWRAYDSLKCRKVREHDKRW